MGGDSLSYDGEVDAEASFGVGVVLGARLSDRVAMEVEGAWQWSKTDVIEVQDLRGTLCLTHPEFCESSPTGRSDGDDDFNMGSLMVNGLLFVPLGDVVEPYVGGGLGLRRFSDDADSDVAFGWQVMTGIEVPFSDALQARIGYRYSDGGDFSLESNEEDFSGTIDIDFGVHRFEVGLHFNL